MIKQEKCKGVVVPMVSPFTSGGKIDTVAVTRLTDHIVNNECTPFVLGTTGEATSIPGYQKSILVEVVVDRINGRFPVYAGVSSNCFNESVQLAEDFSTAGADFMVAHLPYFYPLKPRQMKDYFIRLADAIEKPLILYNIPATTHLSIPPAIIFELSEHPNIVGIKDSERDLERQVKIIEYCSENDFSHLAGWGTIMAHSLSVGSDGLVPSTGNIVPGLYMKLFNAALHGDEEKINELQTEADSVSAVYQKGRNLSESLAALKVMMNELGLCTKNTLPPLTKLSRKEEDQILAEMKYLKIRELANQITE